MSDDQHTDFLNGKYGGYSSDLYRFGFLVDPDVDEQSIVWSKRNRHIFKQKNSFTFVIAPTMMCNAQCFYCYQGSHQVSIMKMSTAAAVIDFINKSSSNVENVSIIWYGGEPTLASDLIEYISNGVISKCEERCQQFGSMMFTNGSIIDRSMIKIMKNSRINQVQICLDGYGVTHNQRKNYVDCSDGYEQSLAAIKLMDSEGISVTLRLNLDINNYESIIEAIDDIYARFGRLNNVTIVPSILGYPDCDCRNLDEQSAVRVMDIIYGHLLELNLLDSDVLLNMKSNNCYATEFNSVVISYDGSLYKCQRLIGNTKQSIGSVDSGLSLNNVFFDWVSTKLPDMCEGCKMLPMCLSGCNVHRIIEGKNNLICMEQKRYFNVILKYLDLLDKVL